jgi:hypothetical protein
VSRAARIALVTGALAPGAACVAADDSTAWVIEPRAELGLALDVESPVEVVIVIAKLSGVSAAEAPTGDLVASLWLETRPDGDDAAHVVAELAALDTLAGEETAVVVPRSGQVLDLHAPGGWEACAAFPCERQWSLQLERAPTRSTPTVVVTGAAIAEIRGVNGAAGAPPPGVTAYVDVVPLEQFP